MQISAKLINAAFSLLFQSRKEQRMSLRRPLPPGTDHLLNKQGIAFLPAFVRDRLNYLADVLEWRPYTEEENDKVMSPSFEAKDDRKDDEVVFTYYEVQGMLSDGYYSMSAPTKSISLIHLWIASDDNCIRSLYLGGSACWICPDNESLFFDAIDPALFPESPDPNVWWCIQYEDEIKVIKILVCPAEEITADFPDEV